jgi:transglutaminase-like putative cysteine protease
MRRRLTPALLVALACLALPAGVAFPSDEEAATERWYEMIRNGQKTGYSRVVWAPSTWNGKRTLHDTTTFVTRSVRNMMGIRDAFETVTTVDLERDDDGTLWWRKDVVEEAGRTIVAETTWTGTGYESVTRLDGQERKVSVPLDAPTVTDAESFLGKHIRAGTLQVGQTFEIRHLDVGGRRAAPATLEVLGREKVADAEGEIEAFKVRERDAASGSESLMWVDDVGALVLLTAEGQRIRRVTRAAAEEAPVQPAEFRITTPSTPVLERVFTADRLHLDLHLQADPDRPLPDFPESPWSKVVGRRGSDAEGWVMEMVLTKYDDPTATTTLPVDPAPFEREFEETVLMPWRHDRVQGVVRQVLGDTKDARKAAYLLARYVYSSLRKSSPAVGQASALEIIESSCGDCSEHALLYVTLCRAAGIPARRCSGYVNVGSQWGAHAWAEVWLGRWVGADPTTGEIGTGARYVFFGYPDDPDSHADLVSSRAAGRMRYVATRIVEGDDDYDLREQESWTLEDPPKGRYVHVLAGFELRDVPRDWIVRMTGANRCWIRADGLRAVLAASADQGQSFEGMEPTATFAGAPAIRMEVRGDVRLLLHSRRRIVEVQLQGERVADLLPTLERVLAPTFAERPSAAAEPPPDDGDGGDEPDDQPGGDDD